MRWRSERFVAPLDVGLHSCNVFRQTVPHFVNLNKDPLLSECLSYFMPEGMKVRFCRKNAEPAPGNDDVGKPLSSLMIAHRLLTVRCTAVLAGVGFLPDHCYATNAKSKVSLVPFKDAKLFRNGASRCGSSTSAQVVFPDCRPTCQGANRACTQRSRTLHTPSRHSLSLVVMTFSPPQVIMGQHLFFRYQDPREMKGDDETKSEFDFDFAQKELSQSAMAGLLGESSSKWLLAGIPRAHGD